MPKKRGKVWSSRGVRQDFAPHKVRNCLNGQSSLTSKMPTPSNTLLIEGGFEELADELAQYIDDIQKKQNPDASSVKAEIGPLLEQGKKDDALKKLVTGSAVLNSAPEKGMEICLSILAWTVLDKS